MCSRKSHENLSPLRVMTMTALLTLTVTANALAEESFWYLGLGLGEADDDVLAETDDSWKIFAGYQLNKYLGFEVGYVDLGDYLFGLLSQDGFFLEALGSAPLGKGFSVFAKAGAFAWSAEISDLASDSGTDFTYGVGLRYSVKSIVLRLELDRFLDVAGGDIDLLSANFAYRF